MIVLTWTQQAGVSVFNTPRGGSLSSISLDFIENSLIMLSFAELTNTSGVVTTAYPNEQFLLHRQFFSYHFSNFLN